MVRYGGLLHLIFLPRLSPPNAPYANGDHTAQYIAIHQSCHHQSRFNLDFNNQTKDYIYIPFEPKSLWVLGFMLQPNLQAIEFSKMQYNAGRNLLVSDL